MGIIYKVGLDRTGRGDMIHGVGVQHLAVFKITRFQNSDSLPLPPGICLTETNGARGNVGLALLSAKFEPASFPLRCRFGIPRHPPQHGLTNFVF